MIAAPEQLAPSVTLHHGDCLAVLAALPDASVDSVVTDPPYGLEFMGEEWDGAEAFRRSLDPAGEAQAQTAPDPSPSGAVITDPAIERGGFQDGNGGNPYSRSRIEYGRGDMAAFQQWCEAWSRQCLRVLKPGGHIFAFGGTRTYHRLGCAVEDAGFEIRESLAWLYGSGFPKSHNLLDDQGDRTGWGTALKPAFEPVVVGRKPLAGTVAGNVLLHGTGALHIDACRTSTRDRTSYGFAGATRTQGDVYSAPSPGADFDASVGRWPANVLLDESQAVVLDEQTGVSRSRVGRPRGADAGEGWGMTQTGSEYDDEGGASRFFYVSKADQAERVRVDGVAHPTVKPLDVMRWLVRLVTPAGGTVLDPFAGSGTTAEACLLEGFGCITIERAEKYLPLIRQRIHRRRDPVAATLAVTDDRGLFDLLDPAP